MELKEQINIDFVLAYKAKDERKKGALSFLKAKIMDAEKANKNTPLNNDETLKVILVSIKQRKQSIEEFTKAGRTDLMEKETEELKAIEVYLPQQMSEDEIRIQVTNILGTIPDDGNRNKRVGQTTGQMNKNFAGQFDIKILSAILNELIP